MNIIGRRKIWFSISGFLCALSVISVVVFGLKFGIDFTGGSLIELEFTNTRPSITEVETKLKPYNLELILNSVGDKGMVIRTSSIDEEKHQKILTDLQSAFKGVEEKRFDFIGPTIGAELRHKSILAIFFVLLAIIIYLSWAFRKVSYPTQSWKYGVIAIIALMHDIILPIGVFSVLGHFYGIEINILFITALLTILGFSVYDTVVIFDRIRENLLHKGAIKNRDSFEEVINVSVNQSAMRSVNTSFVTLLVLLASFFFGGVSIKYFVLALMLGILFGTYSSIFIASCLLVSWTTLSGKKP